MRVEVHKFGGSCLKNRCDLSSIHSRLMQTSAKPVVVISALWGVTDRLLRAIEVPEQRQDIIDEIRHRHLSMSPELSSGKQGVQFEIAMSELSNDLFELENNIAGCVIEHRILAAGEKLAAIVVASYLSEMGLESMPVNADELGLFITSSGVERSIDLQFSAKKIKWSLLRGQKIPIVTGWYGINENGEIRVLDRGGSDLTASSLAFLLKADRLVLWKDVEGVLAINPRWGLDGIRIPYLGYSEASALSSLGTTVLHPTCLNPIEELGIPVKLTSLNFESEGTTIGPDLQLTPPAVRALASQEPVRMLVIESNDGKGVSCLTGHLIEQLNAAGVLPTSVQSTNDRVELIVSDNDAAVAFSCLHQTEGIDIIMGSISGVLSIVGAGICEDSNGKVEQISKLMLDLGIPIHSIMRGKSVLHFLINSENISQALQGISASLGLSNKVIKQ